MKYLHTFEDIDWSGIDLVEIKYKQVNDRLLKKLDSRVLSIVNKMLEYKVDDYDKCLLDVKVRDLKKDDFSCFVEDYHYDWVRDYDELPEKHETHFIYTNVNGTEFQDGGKCKDNSIYQFSRELHRGTRMENDTIRVLIRLSYVNSKPIAQK